MSAAKPLLTRLGYAYFIMNYGVYSIEWEHEDKLPKITEVEYDHLFEYSKVIDGVRMFPFITTYEDETGNATRI